MTGRERFEDGSAPERTMTGGEVLKTDAVCQLLTTLVHGKPAASPVHGPYKSPHTVTGASTVLTPQLSHNGIHGVLPVLQLPRIS